MITITISRRRNQNINNRNQKFAFYEVGESILQSTSVFRI